MQKDVIQKYNLIVSFISASCLMLAFFFMAIYINSSKNIAVYTQIDIIAGSLFVFILGIIVSVSLWPIIFEKL